MFTLSKFPPKPDRKIRMKILASAALAAALSLPAIALAQAPTKVDGGVVTNAAGMTLYTFDKDEAGKGKSACNGPCATNWPPLMAAADAKATGDYTIITRDDGGKQWALKGKPLYLWAKDQKPGDKTGDGFNNVWHVAKP
jgi:predicted lipoprotein with Yx(FWY)xxD motif